VGRKGKKAKSTDWDIKWNEGKTLGGLAAIEKGPETVVILEGEP